MSKVFDFEEVGIELPALTSLEENNNPKPVCKFRNHQTGWEWYVYAGDEQGEDFYCYGYVKGLFEEFGFFMLSEILSAGAVYCLTWNVPTELDVV